MPAVVTLNEARHCTVVSGARLTARVKGVPAATRPPSLPWLRYPSIWSRVGNGVDDVNSWTWSPALGWVVPLLTVPVTLTVEPGVAYRGLIESMVTDTPLVTDEWAGRACAGVVARASRAAAVAAATAATDALRDRTRRMYFAGSKPCTPGMVFAPGACDRYSRWPCP